MNRENKTKTIQTNEQTDKQINEKVRDFQRLLS